MTDKLDIFRVLGEADKKNHDFYEDLPDDEKKLLTFYILNRWMSSVNGSRDLQEFYLISTNERYNKHYFDVAKHPQLQWLCAAAVSPGIGKMRHNWIPLKKEAEGIKKKILELYPNMKDDDATQLAKLTTQEDIDEYLHEQCLDGAITTKKRKKKK